MTEIEKRILDNQKVIMEAVLALVDHMGFSIPNMAQKNECQRNLVFAMDKTLQHLGEREN